jgi:hypothetical protein
MRYFIDGIELDLASGISQSAPPGAMDKYGEPRQADAAAGKAS